jgi:hypothetical protein
MNDIGLGEAVKALREELTEAKGQGDGAWMRFKVGPVNLELQLVVTQDGHLQIGWKVLEIGGSVDSETTQKVSLTLTAQSWDATNKQYTTDFLVSGDLPPSEAASQGGDIDQFAGVPRTDADPEDEE